LILARRALLRLAGWTAALPLLPIVPATAQPALRFAPPTGPMLYTRRLERGLAGGASLTVSRGFAVRFAPESDGYRVEGEQIEVAVEAPERLATLARLERERVETGVFPLSLDAVGAIRGVPPFAASAQLDAAVREVSARLDESPRTPAERAELHAFVEAVHRSAGQLVTALPHDLFAPVDCPREESRAIALPAGGAGQVRTSFTATRDPATGLMREARREVVTEVSGDLRRTVESWTLAPIA
jgi:hypothetical protein